MKIFEIDRIENIYSSNFLCVYMAWDRIAVLFSSFWLFCWLLWLLLDVFMKMYLYHELQFSTSFAAHVDLCDKKVNMWVYVCVCVCLLYPLYFQCLSMYVKYWQNNGTIIWGKLDSNIFQIEIDINLGA